MRTLGRILRLLGFAIALPLALAAGALAVLTLTDKGRENLAGLISAAASSPGSGVRISGISGIWSGSLRLDSVVISDGGGPWLALRGVAVDWSPSALLSSTFKARLVHADRIELARLPQPAGEQGEGGSGGLPVSLAIDRIDLPVIALGDVLAGEVAQVSAEGSLYAEAEPLEVKTDLKIERSDGKQGSLDAKVDFAPSQNRLAADIHGAEPAGGIIANLLGLPGAPPVEISVSGTGPAADWSLTGAFTVGGQAIASLTGRRQLTDGGNRIEAKGEGDFGRFVPETLRPLIAGRTGFDFAGTIGNDGAVDVESASLQSAVLSATARGRIDPAAASDFIVDLAARSSPASLTFGQAEGAVTITVTKASLRVSGTGDAPAVDVSAAIDRIVSAQAELNGVEARLHSDGFDIANLAGPLTLSATARSGGSVNETVAGLLAGALGLDASMKLADNVVRIDSGTVTTGTVEASVSGDVSLADSSINLDVKAALLSTLLPEAVRPQLGDKVNVTATLNRGADGRIRLDPLAASSGGLDAGGSIAYAPDLIDADIKGSLQDLSKLTPDLAGTIGFSLRATGAPAAPDIAATVTSDRITAAGREADDVTISASGKFTPKSPAADIGIKATIAGQALAASGRFDGTGGKSRIDGLLVVLGDDRISGDIALDEAFVPTGSLALSLPDLAPLAALAGEEASGRAEGTVDLSKSADGVPSVTANLRAASIARGDLAVTDAEVTAVVADYLRAPAVSGKVSAASVVSGGTTISNADLSLTRDGDATDFSGGATVMAIDTKAAGRLTLAGNETTVALSSLSARGAGFSAALPEGGSVTVRTIASDSGGIDAAVEIAAPAAPMTVSLGQDPGTATIALSRASVHVAGPTDRSAIDASASLESVATPDVQLHGIEATLRSDGLDLGGPSGPLTLSATAASGSSADQMLAALLTGALKLDLAATLSESGIHIDSGRLATGSASAAVSGDVSLADGSLELDLAAGLPAALVPEAARAPLADRIDVTATVSRDAAGAIRLDPFAAKSGTFDASGSIAYAPDAIDVALKGGITDVSKLSANAAGAIAFDITAKGAPAAPDIAATISSGRLTAAGREITGLALTASGRFDPVNPAADVSLTGDVAGQPLAGRAVLETENGKRSIEGLSLTLGENGISGDLTLDASYAPEGALTLSLPDIGPLAALAFDKAEGAIEGTVDFSRPEGVPQVAVTAKASSIVRGDLSVRNADVAVVVANYFEAPAVSGTVKAQSVTSGTTVIGDVDLTLTRDGVWTGFSGGAKVSDIAVDARGRLTIANGTTTVELASARAETRGVTATLARPTTVTVTGGSATLDHVTLGVGGGTVQVTGTAGPRLNLDVRISAVSAAVVNAFAPGVGASGLLSGSARISGDAAKPDIGYGLDWKDLQTAQTRDAGFGPMTLTSSGTFAGGVAKFTASVGDGSGLGLKSEGSVDAGGRGALSVKVAGQVPFGFLTRRLAAQGLALSGSANVNLGVGGTIAAPVISGAVTSSGARLVDARSGIAIEGIDADIAIAGGVATIRRLDGKLSSGGSLTASGTVGIDAAKGFPAALALKLADARYTDGRIVTTTLNGDLALKGALAQEPQLSGTINLAKTVITVPDRLPGSAAALDVKHKNAPAAVIRQSEALQPAAAGSGSSASGLTLDLTVNAPEQIYVRGRGLDAELGGSIRLTGPLSSPQAVGKFTLRRGRLTVLSRRLDFTRGTLGFSGSLIPTLDLAAESVTSSATVTVGVTGLATDPKFSFSSSPALPQDEVMAQLIFGRSLSRLSPLQIAQLADAAAQLAGGGGSTSLLDKLRSGIGIDDLDVQTDANGGTAVSAGKYLDDRTYVTIQKGDKAGSGKATIDLDVGRGVKLRGEAADDGKAKGGIFFEKEY